MVENIFRLIGYCILFAVNALLFYFLHSHFHFVVLIIMLVAPLLSIIINIILIKTISVTVDNPAGTNSTGRQNEEIFFNINLNNKLPLLTLDAKVKIKTENTFFGTSGTKVFSVPVYAFSGYRLSLPIKPTLPGVLKISAEGIKVKDLMGFTYFSKKINVTSDVTVLPIYVSDIDFDFVNIEKGMLESEESSKRGNDFSEVSDIREYIPGDKLMNIHWKLSAKRDLLMVKDRTTMSDSQLVVLPELLSTSTQILEMIVVATYSVIRKMIETNITTRLIFYSPESYNYGNYRIDNIDDCDAAFSRMFYEKTYKTGDLAAHNMVAVYPEIKAYLHIIADESGIWIKVRENV